MEIQQHNGVVVEVAAISAGLRQAQREGEVVRGEREAPGTRVWLPCWGTLHKIKKILRSPRSIYEFI